MMKKLIKQLLKMIGIRVYSLEEREQHLLQQRIDALRQRYLDEEITHAVYKTGVKLIVGDAAIDR